VSALPNYIPTDPPRYVGIFSVLSRLTRESDGDIILEPELYAVLDKHMRAKQSFLLADADRAPDACKLEHNGVRIFCADAVAK
jgi:hypothetical protein